ncbi:hypothetical protein [Bradyrhizobium sp. UFLA05-112]
MLDRDRDRLVELHLQMLGLLGWAPPTIEDVIDLILVGELLTLEQAGDICLCSDEQVRRQCELAAKDGRPLGVQFGRRWFVSKARLLDDFERGRINNKRRGPHERRLAEDRAKKYEGWARTQEPLVEVPAQEA